MVLAIHPGPSNELSKCRNWKQQSVTMHAHASDDQCSRRNARARAHLPSISLEGERGNLQRQVIDVMAHSTSTFVGQQMSVTDIFEKDKVRLFAIDQFVASYDSETCIGQISCSFPVLVWHVYA